MRNCVWLNRLKVSARNSRLLPSLILKCFRTVTSKFNRLGLFMKLRPASPKVSPTGATKAAGLPRVGPMNDHIVLILMYRRTSFRDITKTYPAKISPAVPRTFRTTLNVLIAPTFWPSCHPALMLSAPRRKCFWRRSLFRQTVKRRVHVRRLRAISSIPSRRRRRNCFR
jgi:hypothetical protein